MSDSEEQSKELIHRLKSMMNDEDGDLKLGEDHDDSLKFKSERSADLSEDN